jgi:hypothetical protein
MTGASVVDGVAEDVADLILRMVRHIVDIPAAVRVTTVNEAGGTTYRVSVAEADMGYVIGKQGRTARSLRTILAAMGMKDKHRYTLDILTKDGSYRDSGEAQF